MAISRAKFDGVVPLTPRTATMSGTPMEVDSSDQLDAAKRVAHVSAEIDGSLALLEKAASNSDNRYTSLVFRNLAVLRKSLLDIPDLLSQTVSRVLPESSKSRGVLLGILGEPLETTDSTTTAMPIPEVELFVHLLAQIFLLDQSKLDELDSLNQHIITLLKSYNRRSLDFIEAKIWFYIFRTLELRGNLTAHRNEMLAALRSATLRHDSETTASLITLLLRSYLLSHDVAMASNLVEKVEFPADAGNALAARYYYYLARIHAVQLNYSSANECVIAAMRKAPQTPLANGFFQSATKLSIAVQLLMGDIPDLKVFRKQAGNFEPYYHVTRAVRLGDLKLFGEVLNKYEECFAADGNFTLVSRLRQNVIKTGIRIISLSYSKISLKDICIKMHLDSEELTEYIVSKAIRDGVIDARINHERGYMQSRELMDVYSTKMPQQEFDQRIRFCLALHTDSTKSMRYPSDANSGLNKIEFTREVDFDIMRAIEDGDLSDFID